MKDLSKLIKLRAQHYVEYDGNNFTYSLDDDLTQYTNVDDITLKRAPANTLEGVANRLILEDERRQQAEAKRQAPVYRKTYVKRSDYPITSLYSDYKDLIEAGRKDWADYQKERHKWRRCKSMFCLNMFAISKDNFIGMESKRSDSRFCCEECRKDMDEARRNYRKYGSYLPVHFIEDALMDTVNDRERKRTKPFDEADLQAKHNKLKDPRKR